MVAILYGISDRLGESGSVGMLAAEFILGIVVYSIVLLAIRTFSKKELQFMKGFVSR